MSRSSHRSPRTARLSVERLEDRTVAALAFGAAFGLDAIINAVATDGSNNVYIAGRFTDSLILDDVDPLTPPLTLAADYVDGFVASYDSAGNLRWAHRLGGSGTDTVVDI